MSPETHVLYRIFSDSGELLYVGITGDPAQRFSQHRRDQPWWRRVALIKIERFESREAVVKAERDAIVSERPKYNKVYSTGLPETVRLREKSSRNAPLWSDARNLGRVIDDEAVDARARRRRMWVHALTARCPACSAPTLFHTADDHGAVVGDSLICHLCGRYWTCTELDIKIPSI